MLGTRSFQKLPWINYTLKSTNIINDYSKMFINNSIKRKRKFIYDDVANCSTHIEKCRTQFKWTIKKFSIYLEFYKHCEASHNLKSSMFYTEMNNKLIEWYIVLKYHGKKSSLNDWLSIYLFCSSAGKQKYYAQFTFDILNSINKRVQYSEIGKKLEFTDRTSAWGEEEFIKKELLIKKAEELLPDDCLTIICDLVVFGTPIITSRSSPKKKRKRYEFEDVRELFNMSQCSDITFVLGPEEIEAHKAILSARSPEFFAMIREQTTANNGNRVEIKGMSANVLKELLRFIYTDQIQNIDGIVDDLLDAADRYGLKRLKELCEQELFRSINVKNVTRILVLADRHECWKLKDRVINFIHKNGLDVLETKGFRMMEKDSPHLITAMYKALIIQRTSGRT